ncbi:hypothetical protein BSKO_09688 [Bryopsis sp. KO-2023]|nr:hypothetical protein BSKO_09688 [Bryopsis sp. KO-2023]
MDTETPPNGNRGVCFLKTLSILLSLALVGMVLHLGNPYRTSSITFITGTGVQNMRVDSTARGPPVVAQAPDKGSASMLEEVPVEKEFPPMIGLVTTHHKTGTHVFSLVLATVCPLVGVDFQLVAGVIPLGNSTFERVRKYVAAKGSDGRIVMSAHGFDETCSAEWKCGRFDAECRLAACKLLDNEDNSHGIVHVVRNPLEMLISAYLYHRELASANIEQGLELWLLKEKSHLLPENIRERFKGVPYHKVLQELDVREGLQAEFLVNSGDEAFRAARNYRDLKNRTAAINIRYEDLQKDYEGTLERVFETINISRKNVPMEKMLEVAGEYNIQRVSGKKHDIKNAPDSHEDSQNTSEKVLAEEARIHMTEGKFDKAALRKVIHEDAELRNAIDESYKCGLLSLPIVYC